MIYLCLQNNYSNNCIREENNTYDKNSYLQMDKILKRLFSLKNTIPIIDFLNAVFNDNISYEAKLIYADKEINNFNKKNNKYISFYADMYIEVIDKEKSYEYEIEFQTIYEKSMAIRMFRYGFERAVKLADYNRINNGIIKIKLPKPYLIVIEEEKDIPNKIFLEIEIPNQKSVTYSCDVLKYFDYNIDALVKENMYLLLPLQIFKLRKRMYQIYHSKFPYEKKKTEMLSLYNELKIIIENTLKAIDLSYNNSKITIEDYDEMTSAIENINSYFISMYGKYTDDIDEVIKEMVKSFYDPRIEERGIEKGIEKGIIKGRIEEKIETAAEMIKDGEPLEKIKKYTKLEENKILQLIEKIKNGNVQ